MVDGVGDLVVAVVGAVTDGAGVLRSGCAALGHGLARVGLANGVCGVLTGIQRAPPKQNESEGQNGGNQPAGGGQGAEDVHRPVLICSAKRTARPLTCLAQSEASIPREAPA